MRFRLPADCAMPAQHGGSGERWLVTYADMITLLMVLFIILYATATSDLAKFQALSESLSEGFGATAPSATVQKSENPGSESGDSAIFDNSSGGNSPLQLYPEDSSPIRIFDFARMLTDDSAGAGAQLRQQLEDLVQEATAAAQAEAAELGLKGEITVSFNERGIVIDIHPDQILFQSGSAILTPGFKKILDVLGPQFQRLPNSIEVHGHTDSIPIATASFPSNWELSAARASSVVRYLQGQGMSGERLSAAGYGDTRPVAPNSDAQGRAKNRRVEILILRGSGDLKLHGMTNISASQEPQQEAGSAAPQPDGPASEHEGGH